MVFQVVVINNNNCLLIEFFLKVKYLEIKNNFSGVLEFVNQVCIKIDICY